MFVRRHIFSSPIEYFKTLLTTDITGIARRKLRSRRLKRDLSIETIALKRKIFINVD